MNHSSFPPSVQVDEPSTQPGALCLAQQGQLRRSVLVKQAQDPQQARQMAHEARIHALLEHPGVAVLHGAGEGWLLLQRIHGSSVDQLSASDLAQGRLVELALAVAQTLRFAHGVEVVHGPLSGSDVVSGAYGEVVIRQWSSAQRSGAVLDPALFADKSVLPPEWQQPTPAIIAPSADVFCFAQWLQSLLDILQDRQEYVRLEQWLQQWSNPDPQQRPSMDAVVNSLRTYRDSMAARQRAQQQLSELNQRVQDLQQRQGATQASQWRAWDALATDAGRVVLLDPDGPGQHLRNQALDQLFQLALSNGDLHSAQRCADQLGDHPGPDRQALVQQAQQRFQQRQQQLRRWKQAGLGIAALLICALLAIPFLRWFEWQHSRSERQAESQRLVDQVSAMIASADQPEQIITAQALAMQALGLAVDGEASRAVLRDSALALIDWAHRQQSPRLAEEQLALALEHGLSSAAAQPVIERVSVLRQDHEQRSLQRQRAWTTSIDDWLHRVEHMDEGQMLRAALEWARWQPENEAEEHLLAQRLRAALLSPQVGPRALASEVMRIGHHSFGERAFYPVAALIPSALDPNPKLREPAVAALAVIRPQHLYEEFLDGLVDLRNSGVNVRHRVLEGWVKSREDSDDESPENLRQRQQRLAVAAYRDMNLQIQVASTDRRRLFAELGQARFNNDWNKIEGLSRQILEIPGPINAYAAANLVRSLRRQNRNAEAYEQAKAFSQEHPDNRELDIVFAAAALAAGHRDEVQEPLERAYRYAVAGGFLQAGMRETLIYTLQGSNRAEDAVAVMQAHGDLGEDMWAHLQYVETLFEADLLNEALAKSYEVTGRWPGFHMAYANRGDIYLAMGLLSEALKAAEKGTAIMPRNSSILNAHARTLAAVGRFDHAAARYLMSDALRPGREFPRFHGMLNAHRAAAYQTTLSLASDLFTSNNTSYRWVSQLTAFRACLELDALPAALDILEGMLDADRGSIRDFIARLEIAIPDIRDSEHGWVRPSETARISLGEIQTLMQGDDEQRQRAQPARQALFERYARFHHNEGWPENIATLHDILLAIENDPESIDISAMRQRIPEKVALFNRMRFHLQQVEQETWPILPIAINPNIVASHPLPETGIAIDQESIDRLRALQPRIYERLGDYAAASTNSPIDHLRPRGSVNPERDLKALGRDHGRIDRGWDFPPQVWRDRREQRRAAGE